jgi:hypothetical protein
VERSSRELFEKLSGYFIEATEENYGIVSQDTLSPTAGTRSVSHSTAIFANKVCVMVMLLTCLWEVPGSSLPVYSE